MENRTIFIEQQKETEKPKPKVLFSLQKNKTKNKKTNKTKKLSYRDIIMKSASFVSGQTD